MIHRFILILITVFEALFVQGQNIHSINGFVFDTISKEALIGASVYDVNSGKGVVTNVYGYYSLKIEKPDNTKIEVSFVGYQKQEIDLKGRKDPHVDVYLIPGVSLQEVSITANKPGDFTRNTAIGVVRLPMQDVKLLPNLFGEVDIIKAFQLTPGVQSGGEAKSELYVRGGSPDQNLIILDDVPLYYVAHFGGFFSIFNADAINDVKLTKGGFPARYGGRLSSVLDVRMKEGNMTKFQAQGTVGLLSSKLMLEGPIKNGKSSYMISARKNVLPIFQVWGVDLAYRFYDLNAKLNFHLSAKDRIFVSFYSGSDAVTTKNVSSLTEMKSSTQWGNVAGAIRYNRIFNQKLFANFIISYTKYRYFNNFMNTFSSDTIVKSMKSKLTTGINDMMVKSDFSYQISSDYIIRFGVSGIYHRIFPNDELFALTDKDQSIDKSFSSLSIAYENNTYIENEYTNKYFGLNAGLRLVNFIYGSKKYIFLEPRISINVPMSTDFSIKGSYSISNQFMHMLSYSGAGMPTDYWMPSTSNVKPSRACQYSFGIAKSFFNGQYELSIEAYNKSLVGLVAFKPGASLIGNLSTWENVIVKEGKGQNYGIEIFLQKSKGKSTGWIGLTVSKAERVFDGLNNGKPFPFKYDRLFDASIVWNYEISKKVLISSTWSYGTGYPITLATEHYYAEGQEVFVYDEINSFRMRDYHRLDFAINFPKKTKWGERNWSISVFNLYNRKNPYYYYYDRKFTFVLNSSSGIEPVAVFDNLKLYQKSLFSIFPSVSYSFKF